MNEFEGIIISINKYKDNDAIINLLTETSIETIKVRSLYSKNSKLNSLVKILNEVKLETYNGGQKYISLRDGIILTRFPKYDFSNDYLSLTLLETIKELVLKFPPTDDYKKYYKLLKLTINNFTIEKAQATTLAFSIILTKILGYDFRNELNIEDDFENFIFTLLSKKYMEILIYDFKNVDLIKLLKYFLEILQKYSDTKIFSINLL